VQQDWCRATVIEVHAGVVRDPFEADALAGLRHAHLSFGATVPAWKSIEWCIGATAGTGFCS
jgi:hypothetical protein